MTILSNQNCVFRVFNEGPIYLMQLNYYRSMEYAQ